MSENESMEFLTLWQRQAVRRWPRQFDRNPSPPIVICSPGWVPLAEALFERVEKVLEDADSTLFWSRCEDKHGALCLEFEIAGGCHPGVVSGQVDEVELESEHVCPRCGTRRTDHRMPAAERDHLCRHCGSRLYTLDEVADGAGSGPNVR